MPVMTTAEAEGLRVFRRGKVRDTFELDDNTLLMVATDRLSAFDVVLPTPIPDKGRVLTQMSRWWFDKTAHISPNHLLARRPRASSPPTERDDWLQRSMRVRRAERIDIECVVRGYISGSGWKEYRKEGTLAGEPLPPACSSPAGSTIRASRRRPRTTPATTRTSAAPTSPTSSAPSWPQQLERVSLELYTFAAGALRGARRHPRRHQVRVRPRRRRADPHRRDLHPGLARASGRSRSGTRARR